MLAENRALKKRVAELERVNVVLRDACVFRLGIRPDPTVIMRFVSEHPQHPAELVLRVLGIASSTYYGWLRQPQAPSRRRLADQELLAEIVDIHTSSGGTYGSPRIHAMLARRGISVGRKRVERLMRGAGLQDAFLRKTWRLGSTRQATPAPDLVNGDFTARDVVGGHPYSRPRQSAPGEDRGDWRTRQRSVTERAVSLTFQQWPSGCATVEIRSTATYLVRTWSGSGRTFARSSVPQRVCSRAIRNDRRVKHWAPSTARSTDLDGPCSSEMNVASDPAKCTRCLRESERLCSVRVYGQDVSRE